VFETDSPTLAV